MMRNGGEPFSLASVSTSIDTKSPEDQHSRQGFLPELPRLEDWAIVPETDRNAQTSGAASQSDLPERREPSSRQKCI